MEFGVGGAAAWAADGGWRRFPPIAGGEKMELGRDVAEEQVGGRDQMDKIRC
jgi:hypothetical protein